jgi:hypothetical protein
MPSPLFCRLADSSHSVLAFTHRKRKSRVSRDRGDITVKGKLASSSLLTIAFALGGSVAMAQSTAQIQAELQKALNNSKYEAVQASVRDNGLVVLKGSVEVFDLKERSTIKFIGSRALRRLRTTSRSRARRFRIQHWARSWPRQFNMTVLVMEPHRSIRLP